jgi:hypothetical protein
MKSFYICHWVQGTVIDSMRMYRTELIECQGFTFHIEKETRSARYTEMLSNAMEMLRLTSELAKFIIKIGGSVSKS